MMTFDPITQNLLVGTGPTNATDIDLLKENGVDHVICLQSDADFSHNGIDWRAMESHYFSQGMAITRIAMTDFDEANIAALLAEAAATVARAVSQSTRVYLHCTAGRERSPTVAAAWLMLDQNLSADAAFAKVRQARASNPYLFMLRQLESA